MRPGRWMLWVLLAVAWVSAGWFSAGCSSSHYRRLTREDSVPELQAAKLATASRANHTILAPTQGAEGPSCGVAVHELESEQSDRILILIHGILADHETWRFIAGDLARDHGVWLVDMPGCGDSQSPRPIEEETYTIPDIAERTLQALRHCLAGRSPSRLTLVGHSYSAAVVVRMFADDRLRVKYADVLEHVDRLVLLAPLDIAVNCQTPIYRQIAEISSFRVGLASATGKLQDKIALSCLECAPDASRALREDADKRVAIMRNRDKRRAVQSMVSKAIPWTDKRRPDWDEIEVIESAYAGVDRECLIVVGMRDEALPAAMSYKMAVQMPRAWLVPLKGVTHSPQTEAHEKCASLIREFVTTGRVIGDVLHGSARTASP